MALTQERLKQKLYYNPDNGVFIRLTTGYGKVNGTIAGGLNSAGYVFIGIDGKRYYAHRLAWLYVHGEFPTGQIDHVNIDKSDNRIANLRIATKAQNSMNTKLRSDNSSGIKGVTFYPPLKKWAAQIHIDGVHQHLGYFAYKEDAANAALTARKEYHGEFARAA